MYDIKYLKTLRLKKNYLTAPVFLVENYKVVQEIINTDKGLIEAIFTTNVFFEKERAFFDKNGLIPLIVKHSLLRDISGLATNERIIAVIKKPVYPVFKLSEGATLVLDSIRNPLNLGTIIRTADWFGIRNIVCSKDTVCWYNAKVLQAAMGSWLHVQVYYTDVALFLEKYSDVPVYITAFRERGGEINRKPSSGADFLVFGNESEGIGRALCNRSDGVISIPKVGGAESLNVAVAVGIVLSQWVRQDKENFT